MSHSKPLPLNQPTALRSLCRAQDAGNEEGGNGDEKGGAGGQDLLSVQRNFLSAEQEMRRVFGSRTVCVWVCVRARPCWRSHAPMQRSLEFTKQSVSSTGFINVVLCA